MNKNPRAAAVPIVSDPADLPAGAQVVSYLFRLNYADPQELQQVLSQYLAGIGGQAPILALPKSSSLLITQSADVLRKLVKMVEQIDVAPAEVTSMFIKLERADAEKVVDMLKEIFDKGDQPSQPGGVRRVRGVIPPGAQQQGMMMRAARCFPRTRSSSARSSWKPTCAPTASTSLRGRSICRLSRS